jgi:hypothetical protein
MIVANIVAAINGAELVLGNASIAPVETGTNCRFSSKML